MAFPVQIAAITEKELGFPLIHSPKVLFSSVGTLFEAQIANPGLNMFGMYKPTIFGHV